MMQFVHIAVIGGGAWGTALAQTCASAGRKVTLWAREEDVVHTINTTHENSRFLPDAALSEKITATTTLEKVADADATMMVVPAQFARAVLAKMTPFVREGRPVMLCAKGIEQDTLTFMTDVLKETLPQALPAVLSGPSFAADVVRGLPTAVTLACADPVIGKGLMQAVGTRAFRPYLSTDLIGAEVGGAIKNVLAIACGIVLGRALGKSAHAALITRGFAEMTRLGVALGARAESLRGLCGLGDLVLTCSSGQSRNMSCGLALGRGQTLQQIMQGRSAVIEGVSTAPALAALAARQGIDMPICQAVADIVAGCVDVDTAINGLLSRPFRSE